MKITPFIFTFICLTLGNFSWQCFHGKCWFIALDHSVFQGVALVAIYFALSLWQADLKGNN